MSTKPETTFYAASTAEAVETTWKLKRLTETHEMRQKALMEEYRAKSEALTDEMQTKQTAIFETLRTEMKIPDEAWGDGRDWAVNIEDLATGTVALVHDEDEDESRKRDDCNCPVCQLRRSLSGVLGGDDDEDEKRVVH